MCFSETWPLACCSSRNESCDTVVVLSANEEVDQAAAERIIARGSAHAHIHARGRGCCGSSIKALCHCLRAPDNAFDRGCKSKEPCIKKWDVIEPRNAYPKHVNIVRFKGKVPSRSDYIGRQEECRQGCTGRSQQHHNTGS